MSSRILSLAFLALILPAGLSPVLSQDVGSGCACLEGDDRVPWGWGSCPDNPREPCDWCYSKSGRIIAFVPRTNKTYKLSSGCESLAEQPDAIYVAYDSDTVTKMEAAGGSCAPDTKIRTGGSVCRGVDGKVLLKIGGEESKLIVTITDVTKAEAEKIQSGAGANIIWWDSYFSHLFKTINHKWKERHGTPGYANAEYLICKDDSGGYSIREPQTYGYLATETEDVLGSISSKDLVFPKGSKVCGIRMRSLFSFAPGNPQSHHDVQRVFEVDGKLYRYPDPPRAR